MWNRIAMLSALALAALVAVCGAASAEEAWWERCEELPSDQVQACFEEHNGGHGPDRAVVARSACFPVDFVYRPHRFGISCDRTMSIRGIRWRRYGGQVAIGLGVARTQGCEPSCANGEVRWPAVTIRLHKLVRCGGRPVYAQLTYRLHGRIIRGFLRKTTLPMIERDDYGEPACA